MRTFHTITPWKVQTYIENDNQRWHEIDGDNLCIAELRYPYGNREQCEEQEANANLIVRAVNSHDELVSIVKELHEAIKRGGDLQLGPKGRNATLEQRVIDVLKKVEAQ